jgi:hypothetical protein
MAKIIADTAREWTDNCPEEYAMRKAATMQNKPVAPDNKVKPLSAKTISLYPNPTTGDFMIKCSNNCVKSISLVVFNLKGTEVLRQQLSLENGLTKVKTKLFNGVYMLKITTDNGEQLLQKLVINDAE